MPKLYSIDWVAAGIIWLKGLKFYLGSWLRLSIDSNLLLVNPIPPSMKKEMTLLGLDIVPFRGTQKLVFK